MKICEIKKMNSGCFLRENHEMSWWNLFSDHDAFSKSLDDSFLVSALKKYAIGYCNGDSIIYRPSSDSYAIMFCKDGLEFWFHVPIRIFTE